MGKVSNSRKMRNKGEKQWMTGRKSFPAKVNVASGRKVLEDSNGFGGSALEDREMASTSSTVPMGLTNDEDLVVVSSLPEVLPSTSWAPDENTAPLESVVISISSSSSSLDECTKPEEAGRSTRHSERVSHYSMESWIDQQFATGDDEHSPLKKKRKVLKRSCKETPKFADPSTSWGTDENSPSKESVVISISSSASSLHESTTPEKGSRRTRHRKRVSDSLIQQSTTDDDEHSPLRKKRKVLKRSCKETPTFAEKRNRSKTIDDVSLPSTSGSQADASTIESREDDKRYGMHVPTYQEIIAYRKECEKMDKEMEFINAAIAEPILQVPEEPETEPIPILDCKHLTEEQLEILLEQNYMFLHNIFNGVTQNDRHNRYKATKHHRITFSKSNLIYNASMILFSYEQKRVLLRYLHRKFDTDEGFHTQTDYFFKVLLPELCTKIFMDTYSMTKENAEAYLEVRPAGR